MLKKICLLFCLTSLFSQILQAQEEYEPGAITTVDNDTIEGYILYEIDSKMSNEIYFRSSESSASKIYKPSQLKSLQFNDGRYFKTVRPDPAVKTESDKVMVKRMMQGKIDVYVHRFKNEVRPNFHLENNENQESVYLIYPKSKLINLGEKLYNYSNKRYLGQINLIKSGVDETNQKAMKYKERSILEDIEKYNNQFRDAYTQKKYDEKIRFSIDLSGGFRMLGREGVAFRAAVYRNKHEAERSDRFSVIRGVSYQHWSNKDKPIDDYSGSGEDNIEWNFISVLPYGVKYAFSS